MRFLLPVLCLFLVLAACTSPTPAPVSTAPPQPTATAIPAAEPTAVPTPTSPPVIQAAAPRLPTATLPPTQTSAPQPTATPEPTATPVPTFTTAPTPTPTSVPTPTAVPQPTAMPAPTPTGVATLTPAPPRLAMEPSRRLRNVDLETLFDEIVTKTEQREAFSEVKETNIGFSAIEDMEALRDEFLDTETELDLYFALVKLSGVRRDTHLSVRTIDGGLPGPEDRPCVAAPIMVLPEISDVHNPTFFVARVDERMTSPQPGDAIVAVNGRSTAEYIDEFASLTRHSTLPGLYWQLADDMTQRLARIPRTAYSDRLYLTLERPSGERYDVALPYSAECSRYPVVSDIAGFKKAMERENFNVFVHETREIVLLQWLDFELDELTEDIPALMDYAERNDLLDYDLIIDVTLSGGGSGGAYAIQRLVDQPFRPTFGNVRISDLGEKRIERYTGRSPGSGEPVIFGLNLSRAWLIDWARTDATEAIRRGDEYTAPVPFKLAHLPKDSDGVLQPAPVHFSGKVTIINARTWGGSHLDQFVAMFVDNDLATFIGVPTGGYSNTWEEGDFLYFPGTARPVVQFYWTIGHTIRPNGEVLEGNPAQPDIYIPITRDNFQAYHQLLLDEALGP